MNSEAAYPRKN